MPYSAITLAPRSARPISLSLTDGNNVPLDFGVGQWSAYLTIVDYPMAPGEPFAMLGTSTVNGALSWITLVGDKLIITPDGDVTVGWRWRRKHYELYLKGPNGNSKYDRIEHGPLKMDW